MTDNQSTVDLSQAVGYRICTSRGRDGAPTGWALHAPEDVEVVFDSARRQPPVDTTIDQGELTLSGSWLRSAIIAIYPHWRYLFNIANADEGFQTAIQQDDWDAVGRWETDYDEAVNEACAQIGTLVIPVGGDR